MGNPPSQLEELRIDRAKPARGHAGRWLWWGVAVVACAVLAFGLWERNQASAPAAAEAATQTQAATANSTTAASDSTLDATGYVVARRQATVSSKITGKLVEVLVEEGQRVKAGDVLARLDNANASAALAQAEAFAAQAEAAQKAAEVALADAEPTFRRSEEQFRRGLTSGDIVESARSGYNAKKMAVVVAQQSAAVARASVNVAKQNLDDTIVRAPFSGVVTVKAAEPGEMVSPAATGGFTRTGICTIVDMDSLEVEVDVSESFISRVQPDLPVTVRLNAYSDWEIPAKVLTVIPTADRAKATVKVRVALLTKDARIVPEMGARVAFHDPARGATVAP
jgi:RND family efflux transporter MFP subunit